MTLFYKKNKMHHHQFENRFRNERSFLFKYIRKNLRNHLQRTLKLPHDHYMLKYVTESIHRLKIFIQYVIWLYLFFFKFKRVNLNKICKTEI